MNDNNFIGVFILLVLSCKCNLDTFQNMLPSLQFRNNKNRELQFSANKFSIHLFVLAQVNIRRQFRLLSSLERCALFLENSFPKSGILQMMIMRGSSLCDTETFSRTFCKIIPQFITLFIIWICCLFLILSVELLMQNECMSYLKHSWFHLSICRFCDKFYFGILEVLKSFQGF